MPKVGEPKILQARFWEEGYSVEIRRRLSARKDLPLALREID
jgi:hypothetical protein